MQNKPDNFSLADAMRLANTPAGKQLIALLQATGGKDLDEARKAAAKGGTVRPFGNGTHLLFLLGGNAGGDDVAALAGGVFGMIIVVFAVGGDLDHGEDLEGVVAHDGYGQFLARKVFLRKDAIAVGGKVTDGVGNLVFLPHNGGSDAASLTASLQNDGNAKLLDNALCAFLGVRLRLFPKLQKAGRGNAAEGENLFRGDLIQANGACGNAGSRVGDVQPLQKTLDRAVLAADAVKGNEGAVRTDLLNVSEGFLGRIEYRNVKARFQKGVADSLAAS